MIVYAIRKRKGQWAVSSADDVVTGFTSLDEAINTAVSAIKILTTLRSIKTGSRVGSTDVRFYKAHPDEEATTRLAGDCLQARAS